MSVQAISWVLEHSASTNTARCVLIAIANHVGGDGSGWVYVDRVCREANCSANSYHRAIQWAIEAGELERVPYSGGGERTHVRHRPNLFRFPALSECGTQNGVCTPQNGDQGGTQFGGEGGTQNGDHNKGTVSRAVSRANKDTLVLVFAAWCESTGRDSSRTKLTRAREAKIAARLAEGYSVDDLVAAVRGVALSPFHMGENDRRQKYDDIVTVLRDGSQVEKFRDLFLAGPVKNTPKSFGAILSAVNSLEGVSDGY